MSLQSRTFTFGLSCTLRASHIWASVQILGTHATGAVRPGRNTPRCNTCARECNTRAPLAAAPRSPPPLPDFLREERPTFQLEKQACTPAVGPPAPHPAFKSGRGVSSNLSPPSPRTPPPPPQPKRATKGRARGVPPGGGGVPRGNPASETNTLRVIPRPHRGGGRGQRPEPGGGAGGGGAVEGSGKKAGGSPWEGPSGPGSAVAEGPGG